MSRTRTAQPEAPPPLGKAARTRLRLVEAVRREIEDEGAISAEAVARRADSSPATFYNHFSSKDEAVLAAFDAAMADLVAFVETRLRVEAALEHGLTPFLRGWLTECVGFFRTNSLVFGAARALSPSSAELRRVFADRESEALVHYTRFVRLGQRAGLVRAGDPAALAEAWMLATQGWNHPRILRAAPDGPLHAELVHAVRAMLTHEAMPHADGPRREKETR